ncbi:MAG: AAA family ATPase [Chloroflexi bacterium]|nr:AAA family ATPase [Chloroflexota bacterium]
MKLAIAGKGGVGKTTLAGLLARLYAAEGRPVIAIDANVDANFASAIGIAPDVAATITPIAELKDLIEERTGAKPGSSGGLYTLTPRVDDIPERFGAQKDGIKLLILGSVKKGGAGCICPETALLKNLLSHILIGRPDVVIMDMDAGVEHLGRGTAASVDAFIVVVEPGKRSIQTAEAVRKLAQDLGIGKCYVVGNKVREEADRQYIVENLPGFELLGFLNFSASIAEADRKGISAFDLDPQVVEEVRAIKDKLEEISKLK